MIHSVDPFSWLGIDSVRLPHYRGWLASIYVLYFLVLSFLVIALATLETVAVESSRRRQRRTSSRVET